MKVSFEVKLTCIATSDSMLCMFESRVFEKCDQFLLVSIKTCGKNRTDISESFWSGNAIFALRRCFCLVPNQSGILFFVSFYFATETKVKRNIRICLYKTITRCSPLDRHRTESLLWICCAMLPKNRLLCFDAIVVGLADKNANRIV